MEFFWGARGWDLGVGEGFGGRISMEWKKKFHYPNRSVLYTPKKFHFFWLKVEIKAQHHKISIAYQFKYDFHEIVGQSLL